MQGRTLNISNKLLSSTTKNKLGVAFQETYFFGNMSDACFWYSEYEGGMIRKRGLLRNSLSNALYYTRRSMNMKTRKKVS